MLEFNVTGMTCGHCVQTVTDTLKRLDPEAKMTVDLDKNRMRLKSRSSPAEISRALEMAGYPVAGKAKLAGPAVAQGCCCGTGSCHS